VKRRMGLKWQSDCLARSRPWIQTPLLPKQTKSLLQVFPKKKSCYFFNLLLQLFIQQVFTVTFQMAETHRLHETECFRTRSL
jgi:hypothetical protein